MMNSAAATQDAEPARRRQSGIMAALGAFGVWGLIPLFFAYFSAVSPVTVVANRVLWSLVFVALVLWAQGSFRAVRAAIGSAKARRALVASSILLAANWTLFVWAVVAGHVLEASFGYFITPLVNVALGVVLLGERLSRMQTVAIIVALGAIVLQATGLEGLPLVSLALALTFGFYSYFRKTVPVESAPGLFAETAVMVPVALIVLIWQLFTEGTGPYDTPLDLVMIIMTGPVTCIALLLFVAAARQLPLSLIGMLQYTTPSMHFLIALFIFHEPLEPAQAGGFVLIWISLAVYSYDTFRRRPRKAVASRTESKDREVS